MEAIRKKSLRGSLKHYANPALMDQEQEGAWQTAASEKQEAFDYTQWRQVLESDENLEDISSKAMAARHDKNGTKARY